MSAMSEIDNQIIKKTIALDIDGTLFYTSKFQLNNSTEIELKSSKYYVTQRPYLNILFDYLDSNKEYFDIIVYSTGIKSYIEKLLNFIDKKYLITEIYDREFCDIIVINDKFRHIKNYKKINKNLHNLYLIDDTEEHFANYDVIGYKCKKFKGEDDDEIFNIIDFLEMLKVI
jgi:TFIIF-interacting CTD phosphatase-like protein